jgi:DNA-binding LytR/AlgR family response regulator
MLGIIICDDDSFMLDISSKLANECIYNYNLDAKIICTTSEFKEVVHFLDSNSGNYLYFLDLDFGKERLNGIDIAKIIRQKEPLSKIVFVTSHAESGIDILKSGVEAFGFVEKTTDYHKMLVAYRKYITLALGLKSDQTSVNNQQEKKVNLQVAIDEYIVLPISQILYVESVKTISHFVCYHTVDGSSISVRDTIENVLDTLGDDFMKSHRCVIINKKYVVAVSDQTVKFANGEVASCSFRLKNEVMKKCLR